MLLSIRSSLIPHPFLPSQRNKSVGNLDFMSSCSTMRMDIKATIVVYRYRSCFLPVHCLFSVHHANYDFCRFGLLIIHRLCFSFSPLLFERRNNLKPVASIHSSMCCYTGAKINTRSTCGRPT